MTTLRLTRAVALVFLFSGAVCAVAPAWGRAEMLVGEDTQLRQASEAIDKGRYRAAVRTLRTLSERGNATAASRLGELYYAGRGVAADPARAYRLFERAARAGETDGMFWLGKMYLLGDGPTRDSADADRQAAIWFFEAARRGHPEAQYFLGLLFLAGTGVERQSGEAVKWLQRSAQGGHPPAIRFLEAQAPADPQPKPD